MIFFCSDSRHINIIDITMLLQFVVSFGFVLPVNSPQGILAYAAVKGRDYVQPDDVKKLAAPVFAHRLITKTGYGVSGKAAQVVSELLKAVPVPTEDPLADKIL